MKKQLDKTDWLFIAKHYGRDMGSTEIADKLGGSKQRIQQIAMVLRKNGIDIPIMKTKGQMQDKIAYIKKSLKGK